MKIQQKVPKAAFEASIYREVTREQNWDTIRETCEGRARKLFESLNPNQRLVALDNNPLVSVICGRRGGKTSGGARIACATGEAKPYSITLIISLTLKALKRNWWFGSPSGIPTLSREFKLNLDFNSTELRWEHENGSVGYMLGAESREMLDYIRGYEFDTCIIDECKSFAPAILEELLDEIIRPQAMSRGGRVIMVGTPGSILTGEFYHATCPTAKRDYIVKDENGKTVFDLHTGEKKTVKLPALVPFGEEDPHGRNRRILWSFHKWHTRDNIAKPEQWSLALEEKDRKGWDDDHPSWLREYEGIWLANSEGLVYKYLNAKEKDIATACWEPNRTIDNPTGLPTEGAPWHLVMGVDLGFNDATGFVIGGWSGKLQQLRHVWDEKHPHMLPDDVQDMIFKGIGRFGMPTMMFGDTGGLGKMLVEHFVSKGIPIERAEKTEKNDHIELINSDFMRGRIRIIPRTDLENQLVSLQWDLSKGALKELAKTGKLKEDPLSANDLTDAFLYMWRGCMHHFGSAQVANIPLPGTAEYDDYREKEALRKARAKIKVDDAKRNRYTGPTAQNLRWGVSSLNIPVFSKRN